MPPGQNSRPMRLDRSDKRGRNARIGSSLHACQLVKEGTWTACQGEQDEVRR